MKRTALFLAAMFLAVFVNLGAVTADRTVENRVSTEYEPQKPATEMPATLIDDVMVPYDVLTYAQVVYQSYAVTQAKEIVLDGKKVYELRIDNDSNPNDSNGMYLLYDENWKLIDIKPLYAPTVKIVQPIIKTPTEVEQHPVEPTVVIEVPVVEDVIEPVPTDPEIPVDPTPEPSRPQNTNQ